MSVRQVCCVKVKLRPATAIVSVCMTYLIGGVIFRKLPPLSIMDIFADPGLEEESNTHDAMVGVSRKRIRHELSRLV
jgi:hypothetical protein